MDVPFLFYRGDYMIAVNMLIDKLRRNLKDQDSNSFTDEELLDYINDGVSFIRRLLIELNPEQLTTLLDKGELKAHTNEVTLDDDVAYIYDVRINGKKINRNNLSAVNDTEREGTIECYVVTGGNNVLFFPIPEDTVSYSVSGIKTGNMLGMDDKVPFSSEYDTVVFEYVVARAGMGDHFQMSQEMELMGSIVGQINNLIQKQNKSDIGVIKGY